MKAFLGGIAIGGALTLALIMQVPAIGDAVREATGVTAAIGGIVQPAVQAQEALTELKALTAEGGTVFGGCATAEQAELVAIAAELELTGIACGEEVR